MSGWESNQVEHTFTTGRTMTVRRSVPLQWLVLKAVDDGDPELAAGLSEWFETGRIGADGEEEVGAAATNVQLQVAAKVERAVLEAMFIRPRVWWSEEDMPDAGPPDDGGPPFHIAAADLHDAEIAEVLELAFKGVADAARFRDDAGGADGGKDGAGVGKPAKRAARAGGRKR